MRLCCMDFVFCLMKVLVNRKVASSQAFTQGLEGICVVAGCFFPTLLSDSIIWVQI